MDGQEEDFSSLSIVDRLQHKVKLYYKKFFLIRLLEPSNLIT
jgi:hypothetical protein